MARDTHPYIPELKARLKTGLIDRREFLRTATLLGLSAASAYAFAGVKPAAAEAPLPKGGTLKLGMRCQDLVTPHTYSWIESSNSARQHFDYLTVTGVDNITRPSLAEKWDASEDLKTWTLYLRRDVKWHNGRGFNADDVVWNLQQVMDPKVGSSVLGLMKSFLIEDVDLGEKDAKGAPKKTSRLWAPNAIEKVDDYTVRLNGKVPNLAVPEQLYHYPLLILDPADKGVFKIGANGTGPFMLTENEVGQRQMFKPNPSYWGGAPYLDQLEFIDLGDDPAAAIGALASKQVDGLYFADVSQVDALKQLPDLKLYQVQTAYTAVARMRPVKPFDDKRVRQAMRLATDPAPIVAISQREFGSVGEHHHVSPVHPEYAKIPVPPQNIQKAKALLAEAGYPNGIDVEFTCRSSDSSTWELIAAQAMVVQWKDSGINATIKVLPSTEYWDVWTKVPFGFTTWAHRPLGVMTYSLAYRTGGSWNESGWSNSEFDTLLTQAEGLLDVDKRRVVMAKLEAIMEDDGPIVQPVWRAVLTFMDKKVEGFKIHPTGYITGRELAVSA